MISVQEATQLIIAHKLSLQTESVELSAAGGRILAEEIVADRDFPPFDRVTMDGIAINYKAWESGLRLFAVQEISAAGTAQITLQNSTHCIEVMTGTMVPAGCDTVIRYEDLAILDGVASVHEIVVAKRQNIHGQGTDKRAGEILVRPNVRITAAEIGIAASVGKSTLRVRQRLRIALVSSGDELVEVHQSPLPHEIRKSNVYQISTLLSPSAEKISTYHVRDTQEDIAAVLNTCLAANDVIVLSGGVSEGKYDFIPGVLESKGVKRIFHKVAQRPGKPFWFGVKEKGPVVFALPGNPVSSFLCTLRYILPWIHASEKAEQRMQSAVLAEDYVFNPNLTCFLQVCLEPGNDGKLLAFPFAGHGSGDFANLADADGFLELPSDRQQFRKGEAFPVWRFR